MEMVPTCLSTSQWFVEQIHIGQHQILFSDSEPCYTMNSKYTSIALQFLKIHQLPNRNSTVLPTTNKPPSSLLPLLFAHLIFVVATSLIFRNATNCPRSRFRIRAMTEGPSKRDSLAITFVVDERAQWFQSLCRIQADLSIPAANSTYFPIVAYGDGRVPGIFRPMHCAGGIERCIRLPRIR